jgi:hypothetical protein
MPDPADAGEFLLGCASMVHGFSVKHDDTDADSWWLNERSGVGLADASRALVLAILVFATSQGAAELSPDSSPPYQTTL